MSAHILVVDDDPEICTLLTEFFGRHEHQVTTAHDGRAMFDVLDRQPVDLVILDIMMPGEDGLSLCRRLRTSSQTPVIMLTAIGEDTDRIVGLELGADDYLSKPFNPRELLARVRAVLRRRGQAPSPEQPSQRSVVGFAGWSLDLKRRELRSSDQALVPLSAGEFDLLLAFIDHPHHVLTRDQLLDLTRGRAAAPFDRSIDVQVSRLRRKIELDPQDPILIKTVRSGGYMFTPTIQRH